MSEHEFDLSVYSHRDCILKIYKIRVSPFTLEIESTPFSGKFRCLTGQDPEWLETNMDLPELFSHDNIQTPQILPGLFEYAWKKWRAEELTLEQLQIELQLVADWLNQITKSKPKSAFWQYYF